VKRNRQKKKRNGIMIFILLALLIVIYWAADYNFRKSNQEKYADKIAYYEGCVEWEKEWIASQQHELGAIYLYELEAETPGTINPYFACLAARGLLVGEVGKKELTQAKNYLNWHTQELIYADGMICDYSVEDLKLISKGTFDSVDSYIAVYLSLVAEYGLQGGNLKKIEDVEETIDICIKRLQELTQNGLTQVSPSNGTYYFMDNVEVLDAYKQMNKLLEENKAVKTWEKYEEFAEYFQQAEKETKEALQDSFWSKEEQRFEIGFNSDLTCISFKGMENVYPDGVAQIYPIGFDIHLVKDTYIKGLYMEFSKLHDWKNSEVKDGFTWPVLAYIAVQMDDIESAEEYVREYKKVYMHDRSYPMNTMQAAWIIKGCEAIKTYYKDLSEASLFDMVIEEIRKQIG